MEQPALKHYALDLEDKNKNSRYKKSPVVATELLLLAWLEKNPNLSIWF
ncbi:hypothetical protein [Vibrio owensii]|nr:hypothetical protein [Vibrio owensii]